MNKKVKADHIIKKIAVVIGFCLFATAVFLPFMLQWSIKQAEKEMKESVRLIRMLIPEVQNAVPEDRWDNSMAQLSLNNKDYIGLLEFPLFNSVLPVCAERENILKSPYRFQGNIYDKTIQIGGTSQKGQYDFYRDISVGDSVYYTDMEGYRYSYAVTDICYEKKADKTTLNRKEAALTLFIKNIYAFEYIIIYCN